MSFKKMILRELLNIHHELRHIRKELRIMADEQSANFTELSSNLDQINEATNQAANDVETLASLLQEALNRSDMTDAEEAALKERMQVAIAGSSSLADRLRSIASNPGGEVVPPPAGCTLLDYVNGIL